MTIDEIVYVWICARLEHPEGPVIDLYQSDPWEEPGGDGAIIGRTIESWWESLAFGPDEPGRPADIAAVDQLLLANGYQRLNDWTTRRGRSGRAVHSADAWIRIEDIR